MQSGGDDRKVVYSTNGDVMTLRKVFLPILLCGLLVSCLHAPKAEQKPFAGTLEDYKLSVAFAVANNWAYRVGKEAGDKHDEALIRLTILRNGEIKEITFVKRATDPEINASILTAIKKSEPFPAFPENFSEDQIEVGIRAVPKGSN